MLPRDRVEPPVFRRLTVCVGLVVLTDTDPNETVVTETPRTPGFADVENATVLQAKSVASAVMVARRVPVFDRACRNVQEGKPVRPGLWTLQV